MEFLRLLLRRRFARAQVATSWNVGCFLRLSTQSSQGVHWPLTEFNMVAHALNSEYVPQSSVAKKPSNSKPTPTPHLIYAPGLHIKFTSPERQWHNILWLQVPVQSTVSLKLLKYQFER